MTERLKRLNMEIANLDKTFSKMENNFPLDWDNITANDRRHVADMLFEKKSNYLRRSALRKAVIKAIGTGEDYKRYHDVFIWGDRKFVPVDIIEKVKNSLMTEYGISMDKIYSIMDQDKSIDIDDDAIEVFTVEDPIREENIVDAEIIDINDKLISSPNSDIIPVRSISFTPEEVAEVVSDLLVEEYHCNERGDEMVLKDHITPSGKNLLKKVAEFVTDVPLEQEYIINSAMSGYGSLENIHSIPIEVLKVRRQKIVDAFKEVHTGVIKALEHSEYAKYFGYENALLGYNNIIQSITNPAMEWETLKPILKQYGMEEKMYVKDTYDKGKYLEMLLPNRSYIRVIPIDRMNTRVEIVPNIDQVRLAWFEESDFIKGIFRNTPEFISTLSNTLTMYPLGFEYSPEGLKIPVVNK